MYATNSIKDGRNTDTFMHILKLCVGCSNEKKLEVSSSLQKAYIAMWRSRINNDWKSVDDRRHHTNLLSF